MVAGMTYELIALDDHEREQARYPVATLPFNPDDVLIVQVSGAHLAAEIERLRAAIGKLFPIDRVLFVSEDVRFLRLEATGA